MKDDNHATMEQVVDKYLDNKKYYNFEGDRGVTRLCSLLEDIGYTDTSNFNQLDKHGCLIQFLADNSAAIDAIIEFIKTSSVRKWKIELRNKLSEEDLKNLDPEEDEEEHD